MREPHLDDYESISLCETLDRVLNKGIAIQGDIIISVADVDLIYLGLKLLVSSVETAFPVNRDPCALTGRPMEV